MTDYKVTAFDLKLALLRYFRFERQWVCVDEFRLTDVIADSGTDIIEVEVKVNKGDLVNKEAHKNKHQHYRIGRPYRQVHPSKFYFCVPESLVSSAFNVCAALNSRYGVIAFNEDVFKRQIKWGYTCPHQQCLRMARMAKKLHDSYANHQRAIAMRTSSKIVSLMGTEFRRRLQNCKGD